MESKMLFTEYEKMCNDFSRFEQNENSEFLSTKWVVTEKIHGANFSFHTNGNNVQVARRRNFILEESNNFFNYQSAEFMKTYPDKMKDVYSAVCRLNEGKEITQVSIYGEMFGGKYYVDGKNLCVTKHKGIQQEIQYSPDLLWCGFDISYRVKDQPDEHEYLDADEVMKIFEQYGIFHLKPLLVGTMSEALNYEIGFDSTIPEILNLPPLEKGTNKAEGVVAKPIKNMKCQRTNYDSDEKTMERLIVKIKIAEFTERRPRRDRNKDQLPKEQSVLSSIMSFVTEQRLANAISKIGDPSDKEIEQEIIDEFTDDVFTDIEESEKELYEKWKATDHAEQIKVKDIIMKKARGIISRINS